MPSDVAISAIAANSTDRDVIETPRPAVATTQAATASSPGSPSPTLRLDPALGLVVIEFLGKTGAVTSSIPTQQQLQAYRAGTEPVPGQHVHQAATATSRDI
jgi:hypothetical protein